MSQSGQAPAQSPQEKSVKQMEVLLRHSAQGVHVLFDNSTIAGALNKSSASDKDRGFDKETLVKVQELMAKLIAKESLDEKKAYLEKLDEASYHLVIRTYLHIVENTIRAESRLLH